MKEYWYGSFKPNDKEEASTSEESVKAQYYFYLTTKYGPGLSSEIRRTLTITEPDTASWEIFDDQSISCNFLCRPRTLDKWKYKDRLFELIYYPFPGEHRLLVEGRDSVTTLSYEAFKRRKIHRTATVAFLCFLVCIVCVLSQILVNYKGVVGGLMLGLASVFATFSLFSLFLAIGLSFPKPWSGDEVRNLRLETSTTKGDRNGRTTASESAEHKFTAAAMKTEPELQQENFGFEGDTTQKIVVAEINPKSESKCQAHINAGVTELRHAESAGASHAGVIGQSRDGKTRETGKRGKVRLPPVEQKGRDSLLRLQKLQQQQE